MLSLLGQHIQRIIAGITDSTSLHKVATFVVLVEDLWVEWVDKRHLAI